MTSSLTKVVRSEDEPALKMLREISVQSQKIKINSTIPKVISTQ